MAHVLLTRLPVLALLLWGFVPAAHAQALAPVPALEPVWGAPAHCPVMLQRLNQRASQPQSEDYVAVGQLLEAGDCVVRNEARASQFYGQAALRGNPIATRRLALLFGTGRGVPQSYANAGAWLAGKGGTEERIEAWDYSIGVAYTLITATLESVRYPADAWPAGLTLALAIEADAQRPRAVGWRVTGERTPQTDALAAPMAAAFDAATVQALARMAPVDSKYKVAARVTLPITVQRERAGRFVVTEQEPLLR
jgi:hypothetical protein